MIYDKVVIGAPIHEYKAYCIDEWLEHVCTKLTYPNYEVIVVDNSEDKNWHRQFIGRYPNLTVDTYRPSKRRPDQKKMTIQEILAACQNKIVTFAKRKKAVSLFSNECDNFTEQLDVIEQLQSHNKLVVGGFYQHGFGENRYHMIQQVDEPIYGTHLVSNKIRLIDYEESAPMLDGKLHQAHGFGIGCVLLDMDLFNKYNIKFRSDFQGKGLSDSYLFYDCATLGIEAYIDTSINVIHANDSWGWKRAIEGLKGKDMG